MVTVIYCEQDIMALLHFIWIQIHYRFSPEIDKLLDDFICCDNRVFQAVVVKHEITRSSDIWILCSKIGPTCILVD